MPTPERTADPSPGPEPVVTITIVLHNSEEGLSECLAAIRPDLASGFAELVAVDNASPDGSVGVVEREAESARIVRADGNGGFAAGVNLAWPHVRGRYWLLLNPDATLDPGSLRALVTWMDEHPQIGVGSAEIRDRGGGGPFRTGRALPSPWLPLLEASRLHLLLPRRTRGRLLRGAYWTGGDQLDAGWVPGTAMIVRRSAVEAVGLLDEAFFLYGEDLEWCWRMRAAGWRIGVCSEALVRHDEGTSSAKTFGADGTNARMIDGEIRAARAIRGAAYARGFALATAVALWLESLHPRRERAARRDARAAARGWSAAARGAGR